MHNLNSAQIDGNARLKKFDSFFHKWLGVNTITVVEGVTGAIVWGLLIVQLREILPGSPILRNFIAYLLAWFSQRMVISAWKESDLFKQQTEEQKFLNTTGLELLKEDYEEQNVYQYNDPDKDRYIILKDCIAK